MVSFTKAFISTILFIGGSFFIPGGAGAGDSNVKAPFNVGEVIERVSHHPRVEGDRIVIQDRAYEAEFKEGRAVIKAKEGKPGAKDVVIPVSGRPEVREGRVVYSSWDGEVDFEGGRRGLRYRERGSTPYGDSLVERYTGNAAKLKESTNIQGTKSGEFIIDSSIVYIPAPFDQFYHAIATDGTNYLVVWEDYRNSFTDIYGARVDPSGRVLDPGGIEVCTAYYYQWNPAIAFDGSNYLVVWNDDRSETFYEIYGTRITPSGVVLDPNGIAISTNGMTYTPSVAFNDTNYLVIWADWRNSTWDIYGSRVTPSGNVLDTSGIAISTATNDQDFPKVAFDGSDYLAVWRDARNSSDSTDIYGARISPSGQVLDTTGISISLAPRNQGHPAIACDGNNCFIVWDDYRGGISSDIYGTRVTKSGVVLDSLGIAISTETSYQNEPAIAFDGSNYLVAWDDSRNGPGDIYGARVSTLGTVLDPDGILISTSGNWEYPPTVAFNGSNYLILWCDWINGLDTDLYGTRVTPAGMVLDSTAIAIATVANRQEKPAIAFDGNNYFVVWEDHRKKPDSADIYGARVAPSGLILDPTGIAISAMPYSKNYPCVAFDGTNYLVAWQGWRPQSGEGINAARVSPSGQMLDTVAITVCDIPGNQSKPAIAFDGSNYLVVWFNSPGGNWLDIYGARVSPSGTVLDPNGFAISTAPREQYNPAVTFGGNNYLVVWSDYRLGSGTSDIFGARVSPSGVVLDTAGIAICLAGGYQWNPRAAYDGRNYFVVWETYTGNPTDIYGARMDTSGRVVDPSGIAISTAPENQMSPSLTFDGSKYLVAWEDYRNDPFVSDIFGAWVDTSGSVVDSLIISSQEGNQTSPNLTMGNNSQLFISYSGFSDSINNHPTNAMRIWGKFCQKTGIAKDEGIGSITPKLSLRVYPNPFQEKAWVSANVPGRLKVYDALGRLVREFPKEAVKPGPLVWDGRDERGRRLPGGVYFLRFEYGAGCETRKAVLVR